MSIRVLIAPDKFKGTLSAREAAEAIARGWHKARPADVLDLLPISDGGDGFGEVLGKALAARALPIRTVNAAHEPCTAKWWWEAKNKTAIVESAQVIGLAVLPPGKFHPFELDTFGLGGVLRAAGKRGAERCIVGVGGSATNDGGFGLARTLGWRFLDSTGGELARWIELERLAQIVPPRRRRLFKSLVVAVDVRNPLLGIRGATRVYGPQKGMRPQDFAQSERCLRRLAELARSLRSGNVEREPGAGAAGGLGFGLALFLGARFVPGFDLVARQADLKRRLAQADLVITGEGAVDCSTLMGKGAGRMAEMCEQAGIPCIGLAGVVKLSAKLRRRFARLHELMELTSPVDAKASAAFWLERLSKHTAQAWA